MREKAQIMELTRLKTASRDKYSLLLLSGIPNAANKK
jgi:hypothetical protein